MSSHAHFYEQQAPSRRVTAVRAEQLDLLEAPALPTLTLAAGAWDVIEGDCRLVLARLPPACAHLVLTDFPYAVSRQGKAITRRGSAALAQDFGAWDRSERAVRWLIEMTIPRAARALGPSGAFYAFTSHLLFGPILDELRGHISGTRNGFIPWCKTNPAPSVRKSGWLSATELVLWAHRPGLPFAYPSHRRARNWFVHAAMPGATRLRDEDGETHPNEKPVPVLERIIRATTRPGDLVLDFLSGSGAAGEAALRAGRRFLGIELDPKWARASRRRLAAVEEQLSTQTAAARRRSPRTARA